MQRDLAGAQLRQEDYERLRPACRFDATLPETYESWLALVAEGDAFANRTGQPHEPIDIDVEEFMGWCAGAEVRPCLAALRAFLIVKRHGMPRDLQAGAEPPGGGARE